jgi:hypothetical protein
VAEAAFAVQIETKGIRQLYIYHQQFTEAETQNVGTLLANFENLETFTQPMTLIQ